MNTRFPIIERVTRSRQQTWVRCRPSWRPVRGDEEIGDYTLTEHAAWRAASRNLSEKDIHYVLRYGQVCHCAGAVFYFLGQRHIPTQDLAIAAIARLEGTLVVTDRHHPTIITVYRNRAGLKGIRKKFSHLRRRPR